MPGLQVVDIVCAIISAYTAAHGWFQGRKDRKESKRKQKAEHELERSLVRSPLRLRGEYDHDLARLGKVFARGDGKNFSFQFLALVLP
jgi:hypothetical protein